MLPPAKQGLNPPPPWVVNSLWLSAPITISWSLIAGKQMVRPQHAPQNQQANYYTRPHWNKPAIKLPTVSQSSDVVLQPCQREAQSTPPRFPCHASITHLRLSGEE